MAKKAVRAAWFKFFRSQRTLFDAVPDENIGKGVRAALAYFDGEDCGLEALDPLSLAIFNALKKSMDEAAADFEKRVENGRTGGRPPKAETGENEGGTNGNQWKPEVTNANQCEQKKEERREKIEDIHSFNLACAREEDLGDGPEGSPRTYLGGNLGKGVVMLSDEQMGDLLDRLSLDEFNHYVAVVADCELNGKPFRRKTHYQAILDMAKRDRKIRKRRKAKEEDE